ncbi:hypothetical protein V6C45_20165 [Paenibacillus barengoltzii]|jgi:hypothetical protein
MGIRSPSTFAGKEVAALAQFTPNQANRHLHKMKQVDLKAGGVLGRKKEAAIPKTPRK